MALDPAGDYLNGISDHGSMAINGMQPDFKNKLFQLLYTLPPEVRSHVRVVSGFRDNITQARLYANALAKYGSPEKARMWVAPPGSSNHNKGLAADLGWDGGGLGSAPPGVTKMLHDRAAQFGLNFPLNNEDWHIEPIGIRGGQQVGQGVNVPSGLAPQNVNNDPEDRGATIGGPYGDYIRLFAAKYGYDPNILYSQMMKESGGNPRAYNTSSGAAGLAQFIPNTAKAFGITDPYNPAQSLEAQAKYMAQLKEKYGRDDLALAAYNWGPGNVDKIGGDLSKAPSSVQSYVKSVLTGAPSSPDMVGTATPQSDSEAGTKPGLLGTAVQGLAESVTKPIEGAAIGGTAGYEKLLHDYIVPALESAGLAQPSKSFQEQDLTRQVAGTAQDVNTGVENLTQKLTGETPIKDEDLTFLQKLVRDVPGGALAGGVFGGAPGAAIGGAGTGAIDLATSFANANAKPPDYSNINVGAPEAGVAPIAPPGMESMLGPQPGMPGSGETTAGANPPPTKLATPAGQINPADMKSLSDIVQNFGKPTTPQTSPATQVMQSLDNPTPEWDAFMRQGDKPQPSAGESFLTSLTHILAAPAEAATPFADTLRSVANIPNVSQKAYEMVGWPAIVSAGFIGMPLVVKGVMKFIPPRIIDLEKDIAPGTVDAAGKFVPTQSAVRPRDILSGYYFNLNNMINSGLKRAGTSWGMLKLLEKAQEQATSSIDMMNSFLNTGTMRTWFGDMVAGPNNAMSIIRRAVEQNPQAAPYLNDLRVLDEFQATGTPFINGETRAQVQARVNAQLLANPKLADIANALRANRDAWYDFMVSGDTLTPAQAAEWKKRNISVPSDAPGIPESNAQGDPSVKLNPVDELLNGIMYGTRGVFDNQKNLAIIDAANTTGSRLFQRLTKAQVDKYNEAYAKSGSMSIVKVWRNGEPEYYATDPVWGTIMNNNPHLASGMVTNIVGGLKRLYEAVGTGSLNMGYGTTSLTRSFIQQKLAAPANQTLFGIPYAATAGPLGMALAGPRMVLPQMLHLASQRMRATIMSGEGGLPFLTDGMRSTLADLADSVYNQSYRKLWNEGGGGHSISYMEDAAKQNLDKIANSAQFIPDSLKGLWNRYTAFNYGFRGLADAAYFLKNVGIAAENRFPWQWGKAAPPSIWHDAEQIINDTHNLTGNPRVKGGTAVQGPLGSINVPTGQYLFPNMPDHIWPYANAALQGAGKISNFGRDVYPWFNVQMQSMKNLFDAYWNNPIQFGMRTMRWVVLPTITNYLWNKGIGNDPSGESYSDYQMNGRPDTEALNWIYGGIPGRPRAEGLKVPIPQEMGIMMRTLELWMDHGLTGNHAFTTSDDMLRTLGTYLTNTVLPQPPRLNASQSSDLLTGAYNAYSSMTGNVVSKRDVFTQPGHIDDYLQQFLTAMGGTAMQAALSAWSAGYDAEDAARQAGEKQRYLIEPNPAIGFPGVEMSPTPWEKGATSEFAYRMGKGTPGVRELLDIPPTATTRAPVDMARQEKMNAIGRLVNDYRQYGQYELKGMTPYIRTPSVRDQKRLERSGAPDDAIIDPDTIGKRPGIDMPIPRPTPSSPMYYNFLARLAQDFSTNKGLKLSPVRDVTGFNTFMSNYSAYQQAYQNLKKYANTGNTQMINTYLQNHPEFSKAIAADGLAPGDRRKPDRLMNLITQKLQHMDRYMYERVTDLEGDITNELHASGQYPPDKQFKLEDIAPWAAQ